MKIILLITCLLCLASASFGKPKREAPTIELNPADTLYIQVIDSVRMGNIGRNDRFRRIRNTLEEVFEEADFPMQYKIMRFSGNRLPPDQPSLHMTIMKWGDYGLSQIEVQFSASLRREYDRNKLGMFYHRGGSSLMADERVYKDVLRKALEEMVFELGQRLAAALDDEAEVVDAEADQAVGQQ
ncbi:hypothetical protein [Pelagicoccus sp. SDUM812003]|uniref:hypothetical protein n=1 Tax=Pelagicoccus sp. SDUM812003 TaxID=3041267 RepID=UPI00280F6C76|nr:hypothetical protein [Pelagicoccus sp. SDUM812003]MDQ8204260.1 hypothetical protein [Pelagicoccus sp. SDUM812003]